MIIKVCGLRDPENIRAVMGLGADMIGLVFDRRNPRYVSSIPYNVGLLPDYASIQGHDLNEDGKVARVGVFGSDMPQNIITMAYNYKLDYVQLYGKNDEIMINNLRLTLRDEICPGIKFIKAIGIADMEDVGLWRKYKNVADMLLFYPKKQYGDDVDTKFDWSLLDYYDGDIPFIISGGIGPEDVENVLSLTHPCMAGIDINSRFETSPAVKDISLLKPFIESIRNG